jgi:hypothetical protein
MEPPCTKHILAQYRGGCPQCVQINQLADMVNDLVGRSEKQAVEIKNLKADRETHRKVINTLTAKVIALEECVEDVQKKAFPQVRELDS